MSSGTEKTAVSVHSTVPRRFRQSSRRKRTQVPCRSAGTFLSVLTLTIMIIPLSSSVTMFTGEQLRHQPRTTRPFLLPPCPVVWYSRLHESSWSGRLPPPLRTSVFRGISDVRERHNRSPRP